MPDEYYVSVSASSGSVAGDYYVKSLRSGHIDLLQFPLHVSSAQADLEVILVRGNNIAGNVRTEKGSPANVSVYLIPTITPSTRQDLARRSSTDAQGNFVLRGVAPGSYYLSSQNNSDRNRLTVPINVGEEATPFMNLILGPDRSLIRSSQ